MYIYTLILVCTVLLGDEPKGSPTINPVIHHISTVLI